MTTTPWRIAAQSLVVLDPETKEPAFTLQFIVDHGQADVARLRMVPADARTPALEMEFSTGGYVTGQPVKQPRWLKAFERPDPNLYLDDDKAAEEYRAGLAPAQADAWVSRRNAMLKRREEWENPPIAADDKDIVETVEAEPDVEPERVDTRAKRKEPASVS